MIAPRRTRLHAAPSLGAMRETILALTPTSEVAAIRRTVVLVPTRAAAEQWRRTMERARLAEAAAAVLPPLLTRSEWLAWLYDRLVPAAAPLSDSERHVLLASAARDASERGAPPPFPLRPALVDEMLAFYDTLRRQLKTIDDFERLAVSRLEQDVDQDRGAARLLLQTRFMVAAFRGYERRLPEIGRADEHLLRERMLAAGPAPLDRVIVTVGDRAADPSGLWAADFDLLARLDGLQAIDIVATEAMLAAGLRERLARHLPGIDERRVGATAVGSRPLVRTCAPPPRLHHVTRDREDELEWVAREIKRASREGAPAALERTAVVFRRPLPYVYLAGQVFPAAGVPHETFDALPLASEPFAAAVDLILDCVATSFARAPLVALLRSPHLTFLDAGRPVSGPAVSLLDRALSEARYLGDPAELGRLAAEWTAGATAGEDAETREALLARAARAAAALPGELAGLSSDAPPSVHLSTLLAFLAAHRPAEDAPATPVGVRHARARSAVVTAIRTLRDAHARFDDRPCSPTDTGASLRRWIERQTFSPRRGTGGVVLTDADAARYGEFDTVYVVGLTEREWPGSEGRNIFFPVSMLQDLTWPDDADRRASVRAAFADLLGLAASRTVLSTFSLEDDALVEPSPFLEDLDRYGLEVERVSPSPPRRVSAQDALTGLPIRADAVAGDAALWLAIRQSRSPAADGRYHGQAGPRRPESYRVSALDRFVECPFVYFAERVLRLDEEPEDEEGLTPRLRGRLVHEVFEAFFTAWQEAGYAGVDAGNLEAARRLFAEIADAHLAALPDGDAAIERARLLGSAASPGMGDIVLELEVKRPAQVVGRLLEFPLQGETPLRSPDGTCTVSLRATADRLDLLADGTFRLYDYKLTRAPDVRHAVQLPAYAAAARARLRERDAGDWVPSEVAYVVFGKPPNYRPLGSARPELDAALASGEARLVAAVRRIERGDFPPQPLTPRRCAYCAYAGVCRKDYVRAD